MILIWSLVFGGFLTLAVSQSPIDNVRATKQPEMCKGDKVCNCCITENCTTCNGMCKDGIFGGLCRNQCPERCMLCYDYGATNKTNTEIEGHGGCTKCRDGYYNVLPNYYQCNYKCSAVGCATCRSATECHSCIKGYFKEPATSEYGKCTACPKSCVNCSSLTSCSVCMPEFDGDACENCRAGFYGDSCTSPCLYECKDNICARDSGDCVECEDGFAGATCELCYQGKHGLNCTKVCPINCNGSVCGRYNGTCTEGCVVNFRGDICEECIDGKHGADCSMDCPVNCIVGVCNRNASYCDNCTHSFQGDMCEDCIDGKYGTNCSSFCPFNCTGNCDRFEGVCKECKHGLYGPFCNISCSYNCIGTTCNITGVCDRGCKTGFSGDRCCIQSDSCLECSSNHNCSKCVDGKHGKYCENDCPLDCIGEICNKDDGACVNPPVQPLPLGGIVGGAVGGLIFITIIVLSVYCFVKRRSATNTGSAYRKDELSKNEKVYENESSFVESITTPKNDNTKTKPRARAAHHEEVDEEIHPDQSTNASITENDVKQAGDDYYNTAAVLRRTIKVRDLEKYVAEKDTSFFENEYQELPDGLRKPYTDARKPENMSKNRYNLIYPYDETRVKLRPPGSDFINACYIDGYMKPKEYIASLGPILKATENFNTFWRMVWQENSKKIVMVTNLVERGSMKCEQYWPDLGNKQRYGDITVTCTSEDSYAEYTMRTFNVSKDRRERQLFHIHYTAWPDKGVPDDVTSLIEFRQKVKATKVEMDGCTIVHCSAGVGRTGTYIALDILTKEGEATQEIDIFGCVSNMRYQRTTMVQTSEQYEYLHNAVVHSLTFGCEAIQSDNFQQYVANSTDTQMKERFEKLYYVREKLSEEENDAVENNKKLKNLNRQGADIPGNRYRPRLFEGRTTDESDYINAVYVNSYKRKDRYIIAQTPLPKTVMDFLTLVIQERVSCIVCMDPVASEEKSKGIYIPADNQDLKLGNFTVTSSKLSSNQCYVLRKINVEYKRKPKSVTREVYHYQCNHWARSSILPDSTTTFLQLIRDTEKRADENPENGPILVHCMNAAERSGLFCAVSILLQKMEVEHEVSVVNTLRQVKVRRSQAIPNYDQYKFCHYCLCTYLQSFEANVYSNFS